MINSCNNSLPLILSNLGYDVWLGNVRGTKYSYYNQKFSMSSDVFWNFRFLGFFTLSIDEMGKYDVPNSIQFILHQTHANKLIYMGHSQGAMVMFSAISQKPELNDQIEMFIALGPAARLSHIKGMLSYITSVSYCVYKCLGDDRNCEFIPEVFDNIKHTLSMCNYFPMWLCAKPLLMMCGNNIHDLDKNIVLKIVKNIPSSTSLKNILHFIQLIKSKKFSMYDNGEEENIKLYGTVLRCPNP
ncbi:hypothetical protein HZS_3803 [Henneguya salminicola]|nr:hypothetical protein HZS_3803 [Henneguya salminicola]